MSFSTRAVSTAFLALCLGVVAGGCASEPTPTNESALDRYFDDAAVTTKVKAALVKDVGAKTATEVSVTTEKGIVQLAGFVSSQDDADRAVAAAKTVNGVREVKDDIRLK
jgi:osmotically-inducible protein OsmY